MRMASNATMTESTIICGIKCPIKRRELLGREDFFEITILTRAIKTIYSYIAIVNIIPKQFIHSQYEGASSAESTGSGELRDHKFGR